MGFVKKLHLKLLRFSPISLIFVCGAAFAVNLNSTNRASPLSQEKAPSEVQTRSEVSDRVWVSRPDGAESCSIHSGVSLSDAAQDLKAAKITIYDSQKQSDGKMHIQMCGASQGTSNAYLIPRSRLSDALALGYREK